MKFLKFSKKASSFALCTKIMQFSIKLTFLLTPDCVGGAGSSTGLVFRLFENFFRLRLSAANAPNPKIRTFGWHTHSFGQCRLWRFFFYFDWNLNFKFFLKEFWRNRIVFSILQNYWMKAKKAVQITIWLHCCIFFFFFV